MRCLIKTAIGGNHILLILNTAAISAVIGIMEEIIYAQAQHGQQERLKNSSTGGFEMKLGISGGLEYDELESEIKRKKAMNGLRRCKAHGHLTEYEPCEQCELEGKTEEYEDWFQGQTIRGV